MSGNQDLHERAQRVAELSGKMVKLAQALEEIEKVISEVSEELEQLGLADRVAGQLQALVIPSGFAESLQDTLDRIAGELENRAAGLPPPPAPVARQPVGEPGGLLAEHDPVKERLTVKCPSCGAHFGSGVSPSEIEQKTLDDRTYVCPRCGSRASYETWDHFLE